MFLRQQGKPRRAAENFLGRVDGESLFQLALLADAGDEEAAVIRAHDGMVHVAAIPALIRGFIDRLEFLFLQRGALRTEGYSKFVHEWLQSSHLVPDPKGGIRNIMVDQGMIDRCFDRMKAFVALAASTIEAEMPSYETIASFEVFSLQSSLPSERAIAHHLQKFSCTFRIPLEKLKVQFKDYARTAKKLRDALDESCDDLEAWRQSVIKKQRSHEHGNGELLAALARGLALTAGSTADNERDFAFNTKNYVKKSNRGLLKNTWRGAERQLSEMAIKKLDCIISFFYLSLSISMSVVYRSHK